MSFLFTMRSTQNNSIFRRDPASVTSLQRIEEDSPTTYDSLEAPPVPPRNQRRPKGGIAYSLESSSSPPPPYNTTVTGVRGPQGEKLSDIRKGILNKKQIAKRGGWVRVCLIALIAIICIVGLVVGLVIGMRNHNSHHRNNSSSSGTGGASGTIPDSGNPENSTAFPAGSYSFETYLSSVLSSCASNSATWTCYPYFTYAQSPLQSNATFQWIIEPVANGKDYLISSSANPFSITFENVSLALDRAGQQDEHYYFQTLVDKVTVPTAQLGSENVVATCHFNQTTLQGYLYTKMPRSFPDNGTADKNITVPFRPWPYAVTINQTAKSGTGEPTCLGPSGQSLGDFSVKAAEMCNCLYMNTGT